MPSVGLEERTEECTETHACDCISRQAAIEALRRKAWSKQNIRKGDEVIYNSRTKAIVLTPETKERYGTILTSEFDTIVVSHDDLEKTGRHFSDIEELLKKMRGEE